jgi:predicted transcriptional regulator YheO
VCVISGAEDINNTKKEGEKEKITDSELVEYVKRLEKSGIDRKVAIKETSDLFGVSRKDVYNAMIRDKET